MFEHAEVLEQLVTSVVPLKSFTLLGHDEGDSVAFIFLSRYEQEAKPFSIRHFVILNGGIYLPLQNIAETQKKLLDNVTGPDYEKSIKASTFAFALGKSIYSPSRSLAQISELTSVFD